MQTRKRILLIGATAIMAVTEAILRGAGGLDVRRVNDLNASAGDYQAIFVEDTQPREALEAVLRANPGIPVILLHWQRHALSLMVDYPADCLSVEHLTRLIDTYVDPAIRLGSDPCST
jgi:hypothetical protein